MSKHENRTILQITSINTPVRAVYCRDTSGVPPYVARQVACNALVENDKKDQYVIPMVYNDEGRVVFIDDIPYFEKLEVLVSSTGLWLPSNLTSK